MNLIFFGPPGSGKGTYASRVSAKTGWQHISTGDLLRAEIAEGTELGKTANSYMEKGNLVPDEIVINMLKNRIQQEDCSDGFILDGFPRTIEQMKILEKITAIDKVLYFKWPEGVLLKKALGRRTCEKCGKIYNVADIMIGEYHFPPISPEKEGVCDDCGGRIITRKDDNEATIKNRLDVYENQSAPLIKYYKKTGMFRVIDVVGPPEVMIPIILKEIGYE